MTALNAADLVVIAGRTLGISTDAVLAQMDIAAAEQALAEARPSGLDLPDPTAAAAAGVSLVHALLRHRPFPRHGRQVAVAAGLQFLSLNGWRADLNPAATAVVVVEALASGQLTPGDAAVWLSPRLSPVRLADRASLAASRIGRGRAQPVAGTRSPGNRTVAGALLAVAVGGGVLLAAACSRTPQVPPAPAGVVHVIPSDAATGAPGRR